MSRMLDVIHYFFEEDSRFATGEQAEAVSMMRSTLYGVLYGQTYKYKVNIDRSGSGGVMSDGSKPYIPPTDFNADSPLPFGSVLDSPLG